MKGFPKADLLFDLFAVSGGQAEEVLADRDLCDIREEDLFRGEGLLKNIYNPPKFSFFLISNTFIYL